MKGLMRSKFADDRPIEGLILLMVVCLELVSSHKLRDPSIDKNTEKVSEIFGSP